MRPEQLRTKIFLDGGDPAETSALKTLLGFLDGQTTNPSLIAKNPVTKQRMDAGEKFSEHELLSFYREVVTTISGNTPDGSVSIEVYADENTTAEQMLTQGKEMFSWIPNAHIKYPTTTEGLKAAAESVNLGMRVNLTLVFTQAQAAAVYAATLGARKGQVFLSPFVGRLDDRGENGMQLIENILRMYREGDGHVEVLTASVRSLHHFEYALALGSEIITAPFAVIKEWGEAGCPIPLSPYAYDASAFSPIPYHDLDLSAEWTSFDLRHELTDAGQKKFAEDWKSLLEAPAKDAVAG